MERILEIADYKKFDEEGPMKGKTCWVVKPSVLEEHGMTGEAKVPNDWTYINERPPKRVSVTPASTPSAEASSSSSATPKRSGTPTSSGATTPKAQPTPEAKKEKKRITIQSMFMSMSTKKDAGASDLKENEGESAAVPSEAEEADKGTKVGGDDPPEVVELPSGGEEPKTN